MISSLLGALIVELRKSVDVLLDFVLWKFCMSGGRAVRRSLGLMEGSLSLPGGSERRREAKAQSR